MPNLFEALSFKISLLNVLQLYLLEIGDYCEQTYEVISDISIPLSLDDNLSRVYDDQQKYGIKLPVNIKPEKDICLHGHRFNNMKPAHITKGIVIYT